MERTSINTDYYWDEISFLCGELLNEMETLVRDKHNNSVDIENENVNVNGKKAKKIYFHINDENVVMDDDLFCEMTNGEVLFVREMDVTDILNLAEVL